MREIDTLIVGQGIAGSLLGYILEKRGQRIHFIDHPGQTAATEVAAGIINPITGRYYVRSWRIAELLPVARAFYRALEAELGQAFYYELPLYRTLFHAGDANDWLARTTDADYRRYMDDPVYALPTPTVPAHAYARVREAARVDIAGLRHALRDRWAATGHWQAERFDYPRLEQRGERWQYGEFSARRVIFCEGWRGAQNPYFSYLPFGGTKGEVLLVEIAGADLDLMLKHRLFVVPLGKQRYWIGATNDNRFTTEAPTPAGRSYLETRLAEVLTVPYRVLAHRAAVRPTVRDRRPFLGEHPEFAGLFIFNGLGTKGASLAPYWAEHLAAYLLGELPTLDAQVDIARFAGEERKS